MARRSSGTTRDPTGLLRGIDIGLQSYSTKSVANTARPTHFHQTQRPSGRSSQGRRRRQSPERVGPMRAPGPQRPSLPPGARHRRIAARRWIPSSKRTSPDVETRSWRRLPRDCDPARRKHGKPDPERQPRRATSRRSAGRRTRVETGFHWQAVGVAFSCVPHAGGAWPGPDQYSRVFLTPGSGMA